MRRTFSIEFFVAIHRMAISTNPSESDLAGIIRSESDLEFLGEKLNGIDDKYVRAATALYSIACYHPFYEGNKRTALLLCELLLEDLYINAQEDEIYHFVKDVACDKKTIDDIVSWLRENSSLSE